MSEDWRSLVVSDAFDNDILPFWDGLRQHQFMLCRCGICGAHYWPMALCPKHEDVRFDDMEWAPTSGLGSVFSWSIVHRVNSPIYQPEVPYALVLIELEEGPIFPTRLAGHAPPGLTIGMKVEVVYDDVPETGMTLPLFKLRE
jgi:uncharacterized OB-fold protein